MRLVFSTVIVAALALGTLALLAQHDRVPTADACSIVGYPFDADVRRSAFVGVVETLLVGDGILREPPLPTRTPEPTSADSTPTATNSPMPPEVAATASVVALTPVVPHYNELVGQGADVTVVERIGGEAYASIEVDKAARQNYERGIRQREAGYGLNSCSLIASPRYEQSRRYVVLLADYGGSALSTVRRFSIVGSDVVVADSYLDLSEAQYRRYLPGVAADIRDAGDGSGTRIAYITAPTVPLDKLLAMIRDFRAGIRPPETGNAGLKSSR